MVAELMRKWKFLSLSITGILKVPAPLLWVSRQCHSKLVSVSGLRKYWERRFQLEGVSEPRLSAKHLVQHVMGRDEVS